MTAVDLMQRALSGDPDAFEAFYARYEPIARRVARGAIGDRPEVDDALQVVWFRLLAHKVQFDPTRSPDPQALIVTMARCAAHEQMQRRMVDRQRVLVGDDDEADPLTNLSTPALSPEAALLEQERQTQVADHVTAALGTLTPQQRSVVELRADDLPTREIGAALGISAKSVSQALINGRRRLRAALADRVSLPPDRGAWGLPRIARRRLPESAITTADDSPSPAGSFSVTAEV